MMETHTKSHAIPLKSCIFFDMLAGSYLTAEWHCLECLISDAIPQAIAKEITFELSEIFYVGVIFFASLKACN
jgi:hypothetical protein